MAKKQDEPVEEWDQIEIGDQVKHAKWGVGTVLFRSGNGENAKAIVVFPEEGQKKLMLKYAKLKKVGSTSLKAVEKLKAEMQLPKPVKEIVVPDEEVAIELGDDDEEGLILEEGDEVVGFDDEEDGFAGGSEGQDR